jgi:hypothetical protein
MGLLCKGPLGRGLRRVGGEAEPYPELGEGGATRSEIVLVNGTLWANVPAQ